MLYDAVLVEINHLCCVLFEFSALKLARIAGLRSAVCVVPKRHRVWDLP